MDEIVELMLSGDILIPHVALTPSFVLRNGDWPPEIELKFELEKSDLPCDEWPNWQLQFLHNQLFEKLQVNDYQVLDLFIIFNSLVSW